MAWPIAKKIINNIKNPTSERSIPKIENQIPPILFRLITKIEIIPVINPTQGTRRIIPRIDHPVDNTKTIISPPFEAIHKRRGVKEIKPRIKLTIASLLFINLFNLMNL